MLTPQWFVDLTDTPDEAKAAYETHLANIIASKAD